MRSCSFEKGGRLGGRTGTPRTLGSWRHAPPPGDGGVVFGSPATWPLARSSALRPRLATGVPLSGHPEDDVANLPGVHLRLHRTVRTRGPVRRSHAGAVPDAPGRRGGVRGVPEGRAIRTQVLGGDAAAVWRMWDGFGSAEREMSRGALPVGTVTRAAGAVSPALGYPSPPIGTSAHIGPARPRSSAGRYPAPGGLAGQCAKHSEEHRCRTPVGRWSSPFAGSR